MTRAIARRRLGALAGAALPGPRCCRWLAVTAVGDEARGGAARRRTARLRGCARGRRPPDAPAAGRSADRLELPGHARARIHPPPAARGRDRGRDPVRRRNGGDARALAAPDARAPAAVHRSGALVMVDQEGGDVRTVGCAGPAHGQPLQGAPATVRRARRAPPRRSCAGAGVNVNLAPVADVPRRRDAAMARRRSFAGGAARGRRTHPGRGRRHVVGAAGGHGEALPRPRRRDA